MPRLKLVSPTDERIDYKFHTSGPIRDVDDVHEDVSGNEVTGHLSTGDDAIEFAGVPLDFKASAPWELDLFLDMGRGGFTSIIPPFLNSATVEITSEGAHYLIAVGGFARLFRGGTADPRDGILDSANQLAVGNVAKGGKDSWRIWPPARVDVVADHPARARFLDPQTGWTDVPQFNPDMEF